MALTLRVAPGPWRAHVASTRSAFTGLVPVVKGNGYGFGRPRLAKLALDLGFDEVAVGTVDELGDVPTVTSAGPVTRIVLTPALADEIRDAGPDDVVTVGSRWQADELARSGTAAGRRVVVKLRSSMGRYGLHEGELGDVLDALDAMSAVVHGVAVHPPLSGTAEEHAADIEATLVAATVPERLTVYVSHLDASAYRGLQDAHPARRFRIRLGTALWHGDKSFFHLGADVLDVRPVRVGEHAGYRLSEVPEDGHLVLVSAGTAHGVHPLPSGASPFHFGRRRLPLLEPPHMHTSMVLAPADGAVPQPGDVVDVQRPLTQTLVDRVVEWRDR